MSRAPYDPEIHHRKSTRLPDYDYASEGSYFVTACTARRRPYFDNLVLRQIAIDTWNDLPRHFPHIELDQFALMPDHLHFLIYLKEQNQHTLGTILCFFKSSITWAWNKRQRSLGRPTVKTLWQRSFIDYIVRNEKKLDQKRRYTINNPVKHALQRGEIPGDESFPEQ